MKFLWIILPIVAATAWLVIGLKRLRSKELRAIDDFTRHPLSTEDAFLAELGFQAGSPDASLALQLRSLVAKLGQVPADSISASTKFYPDLADLPYFDSPDSLDVVFRLEVLLDNKISADEAIALVSKPMAQGDVREFVIGVINYRRERLGTVAASR